jgi:phage/plasmid-like protein (TIGR03299 family)
MSDAVETMMYAGETPWHGKGKPVPANVTGAEVDAHAGIDWTLELKKIQVCGGRGIDGYRAVVRSSDGKSLGVVSDDYSILQNAELRSICDAIVGEGGAHFHTAGSLNGGEDVWYLLQLPGTIVLPGDDEVGKFLLGTTNHVAKRKARILPTPIRAVCQNTVNLALRKGRGQGVAITHIGDLKERIEQAIKTIKMALGYYTEFEQVAHKLASTKYSDAQVKELSAEMFPSKADAQEPAADGKAPEVHWLVQRQRDRLADLFENGKGHQAIRGTAWAALNAVAEFTDWERGTDENRIDAAWFGDGARMKQKAFEVITAQVDGTYATAA